MKQAAFLYALRHVAPRLMAVRKRTWLLLALGAAVVTLVLAWAAVAVLSWVWGQASNVADSGRQAAGSVYERVEQAVPGVAQVLEPWIGGVGKSDDRTQPPGRDVSGADPQGLERHAGLVRTYYANDAGRVEVRYTGSGELQAVLRHYVGQLENAGYRHDILLATPAGERHRFSKEGAARELEVRRADIPGRIELIIVDQAL